jgi:hypothetical protein
MAPPRTPGSRRRRSRVATRSCISGRHRCFIHSVVLFRGGTTAATPPGPCTPTPGSGRRGWRRRRTRRCRGRTAYGSRATACSEPGAPPGAARSPPVRQYVHGTRHVSGYKDVQVRRRHRRGCLVSLIGGRRDVHASATELYGTVRRVPGAGRHPAAAAAPFPDCLICSFIPAALRSETSHLRRGAGHQVRSVCVVPARHAAAHTCAGEVRGNRHDEDRSDGAEAGSKGRRRAPVVVRGTRTHGRPRQGAEAVESRTLEASSRNRRSRRRLTPQHA